MSNHSEDTKRIAKNTLLLYVRMLFGMLVSLYTSRVVLLALGVEDYGIYNVVGGFVGMFSLISAPLSHSVSRFLTFELGRGNVDGLKQYFSTSLLIHIVLALIILIVSESVGLWFLNNKMIIPADRLSAANLVFHTSVFSFMLNLLSVPYNASIVSHEKMNVFARIGIFDILLRLFIVLFIAYSTFNFDRLIIYAILLVIVSCTIQSIYIIYCRNHFEECRLKLVFNIGCWKKMWAFTTWNFIGGTAIALKDQGINVLLNLFFGPAVNTARGLSQSVLNAVSSFSGNFMTALNPQITKSYAVDDKDYMFNLIERGTRFSFYILLIIALPVLFETDFILYIWLNKYPEHTITFVRLVLIQAMIDILSNTIITAQAATGNVRNYQILTGGMLLMNFPISYLCLKLGGQPEYVMFVAIFISICCLLLRLFILRRNINLSIMWFLKKVCFNVLIVSVTSIVIPLIFYFMIYPGWLRFLIIIPLCLICSTISAFFIGCSYSERQFIIERVVNIKSKLLKKKRC